MGEQPNLPPQPSTEATGNAGRGFTIAAYVMGVLSIVLVPIVLGPLGIVFGLIGNSKGDPRGKTAAVVAGVCMIIGLIVGALLFNAMRSGG